MKDPWRDPKGDPFGEEGSGALDDFWPLSPAVMPVGTAGTRIALSLTEPRGPDTCTTLRCDNERQRPGVGFWWQASEESHSSETGEGVRKRIGGRKCCSEWLEPLKSWCFWQIIRPGNENALWLALRSQIASQLYQHWALPGNAQCWYSCGSPFSRQGNQPWPWTWIFFGVVPRSVVWHPFLDYSDLEFPARNTRFGFNMWNDSYFLFYHCRFYYLHILRMSAVYSLIGCSLFFAFERTIKNSRRCRSCCVFCQVVGGKNWVWLRLKHSYYKVIMKLPTHILSKEPLRSKLKLKTTCCSSPLY